jgi:hypothetical protein
MSRERFARVGAFLSQIFAMKDQISWTKDIEMMPVVIEKLDKE